MNTSGNGLSIAFLAKVVSSSTRMPLSASMPPPNAMKTSSCRHITPLGMPVVPPV